MVHPFAPGDHLRIWRRARYHHDAIYLQDGYIVHYTAAAGARKQDARVRVDRLDEVARGDRIDVASYGSCFPVETVLERALGSVDQGDGEYHLIFKNCQHFARWCKTGDAASAQVRRVASTTGGIGGGVSTAVLSLRTITLLGLARGLSGAAGMMSALRVAGSVVGGGAGTGVAVLAAVPATVGVVTVRARFADDPYAPEDEREALSAARTAGTMGAVGGIGVSAAAVSVAGTGSGAILLTTGIKALGAGRMVVGLAVALGLPIVTAGAAAFATYWLYQRRRRRVT